MNANINGTNCPCCREHRYESREDYQWLSETSQEGIVVCNDQLTISQIIDNVDRVESKCCSADGIHEGLVEANFGGYERDSSTVLDISADC